MNRKKGAHRQSAIWHSPNLEFMPAHIEIMQNRVHVTEEEVRQEKMEREAARKKALERSIEEVRDDTEAMKQKMSDREVKAYERLVRYAFRKKSDRTLFVAIEPNQAAQINLGAEERADGNSYAVADALNAMAAAVLSGKATVFMQHKELNELAIGILTGIVVQKKGNLRVADPKNLQGAWRSYLSCETFHYDGNLKCMPALV